MLNQSIVFSKIHIIGLTKGKINNNLTRMKTSNSVLTDEEKKKYTKLFWGISLFPFLFVAGLILLQSESSLPPVSMLDNPPELQASQIIARNSVREGEDTVIGTFWQVNRTSAKFRDISPFVFDALISTEDERFMEHSGVDFRAIARSTESQLIYH